jgi:hypothetical protein
MDNLSLSAEERFENFANTNSYSMYLKTYASYIGVTPEFFSKMQNATSIIFISSDK